jgi:hypothetical protein
MPSACGVTDRQRAALEAILHDLREANPRYASCFPLGRSGDSIGYTPPGSDRTYLMYSTHIAGPEIVDCRGPGGAYPTLPSEEF